MTPCWCTGSRCRRPAQGHYVEGGLTGRALWPSEDLRGVGGSQSSQQSALSTGPALHGWLPLAPQVSVWSPSGDAFLESLTDSGDTFYSPSTQQDTRPPTRTLGSEAENRIFLTSVLSVSMKGQGQLSAACRHPTLCPRRNAGTWRVGRAQRARGQSAWHSGRGLRRPRCARCPRLPTAAALSGTRTC